MKIAAATVVAVDVSADKLAMAKRHGADYTVNAAEEDPAQAIQRLRGAHAAIALAVAPQAFEQAFGSLRRKGTLVFVALPADNAVSLPIFETVLHGITVVGSIVGTRKDLDEVFELHARGRTSVIRETRQLSTVNESIDDVPRAVASPGGSCSMSGAPPQSQAARCRRPVPSGSAGPNRPRGDDWGGPPFWWVGSNVAVDALVADAERIAVVLTALTV